LSQNFQISYLLKMKIATYNSDIGEDILHCLGLSSFKVKMTDLKAGDVVLLLQELQDGLVDGVLLGGQKEQADWKPEILDTKKDNPTLKNKGIIVLIKNWQKNKIKPKLRNLQE
jgi:hypothetical protein